MKVWLFARGSSILPEVLNRAATIKTDNWVSRATVYDSTQVFSHFDVLSETTRRVLPEHVLQHRQQVRSAQHYHQLDALYAFLILFSDRVKAHFDLSGGDWAGNVYPSSCPSTCTSEYHVALALLRSTEI